MDYRRRLDYSSLSTYIECPRKFLFQYVLHFRRKRPSIDLVFGSCWHYGLEVVYKQLMEDPSTVTPASATQQSITAFNALWEIEGAPWFKEEFVFPKSPGNAANMYAKYWKRFLKLDLQEYKVIAVEHPFTVSLSQTTPGCADYIGRLDLVWQHQTDGTLLIDDHKTTKYITKASFTSYECSLQTDGYLTVGKLYYDKIPIMRYNIALCQKSKIDFERFQILKSNNTNDRFLTDLARFSKEIISELAVYEYELETMRSRTDLVTCFGRRPGYACTAYFRPCPFYDECKLRANPLLWAEKPPQGFIHYEWDPAVHEENLKKKLKEQA